MKLFDVMRGFLVLGLLVGCGPVGPEELDAAGDPISDSGEAIQPSLATQESLDILAKRLGPSKEELASLTAVCPGTTNCVGAGYGACNNWSLYQDCGSPYCDYELLCVKPCYTDPDTGEHICPEAPRKYRTRFRYRACVNSAGAQCMDYETITLTSCGC